MDADEIVLFLKFRIRLCPKRGIKIILRKMIYLLAFTLYPIVV